MNFSGIESLIIFVATAFWLNRTGRTQGTAKGKLNQPSIAARVWVLYRDYMKFLSCNADHHTWRKRSPRIVILITNILTLSQVSDALFMLILLACAFMLIFLFLFNHAHQSQENPIGRRHRNRSWIQWRILRLSFPATSNKFREVRGNLLYKDKQLNFLFFVFSYCQSSNVSFLHYFLSWLARSRWIWMEGSC